MIDGPGGAKDGLDVTEMRAMLLLAKRARRRQRTILMLKLLVALGLLAGVGYALRAGYRAWAAAG